MGVATEEMQRQIVLAIQMGEGAVSGTAGQVVTFDGDGAPVAADPNSLGPFVIPEGENGQALLYEDGVPVPTTIILVPAPDAEGTFALQSIDGVLTWVAVE